MITKGKWRIEQQYYRGRDIVMAGKTIICTILDMGKQYDEPEADEAKANAALIAASPILYNELVKAHNIINRLVEEIHKADTKSNKIVERINWPTIRELSRKNAIAKATT